MSPPTGSTDKTNFAQSLMHMIKGNLGTGILAMPISFKHCGLITASLGLPILCIMATFCVHLLVRSSQHLENKMKWANLDYAALAKGAFKAGPEGIRPWSGFMCHVVDAVLIVSQLGICCVYLVFIVDNIYMTLASLPSMIDGNSLPVTHLESFHENLMPYIFLSLVPFVLLISYIRTLKRLSIASACANILQVGGIIITVGYLIRRLPSDAETEYFSSIRDVALGFGSAMFAFEGISVVLPIYTRMKRPEQMGGFWGLINVSYVLLLFLYCTLGILGYISYGEKVEDSITLNLPKKDVISQVIRIAFTLSIFLTYPLQFYVPSEIIWNAIKLRMFGKIEGQQSGEVKFEYLFRTCLVLFTFILAVTVPKLNLLMDLVGSISGTALSITLPAIIHMVTFWDDTTGRSKFFMILIDSTLILISIIASITGSYFSLEQILKSFEKPTNQH